MRAYIKLAALCLIAGSVAFSGGCQKDLGPGDTSWHRTVADHQHKVDVGGYSLNVVDMGTGDPVVMIHGFADSAYCYHKNVQTVLDRGFRVVLPEPPGLGQSDIPPAPYVYSVENQAEAVRTCLDRMGIERFTLVGHSMGGGIALYLATHYPQRIAKLMVIDAACYDPERFQFFRLPGASYIAGAIAGKWIMRMALHDVFYDKTKVTEAMVSEYAQPLRKPGYVKVLAELSKQYFSAAHTAMQSRYGHLEPPLTIVWGREDTWLPPEFGDKLAHTVPNARLHLVQNAGHSPHQEQPEAFNKLLAGFLADGE
jgi:2-hydroxy-6-oxonona-2,4-dienedioate hydrolase